MPSGTPPPDLQAAILFKAVEQAEETIVITAPDGAILYANPAFERITGYTRTEALGKNPRILKSEKQDPAFYTELWQTLTAGKTWKGRLINRRKDGSLYTEEATISPVRDAHGVLVSYVAVKRDVTEQLRLEADLLQAQKLESVGRLAGGVAHEFNNMLTVILGYTERLLAQASLGQAALGDLSEIQQAAERSAALTQQLLAIGRKQAQAPRVLDLAALVQALLPTLRGVAGAGITVSWLCKGELWPVRADAAHLDQVLIRLVERARDAMHGQGSIVIEGVNGAAAGQEQAQIRVADSGPAIEASEQAHLFEPFFKGDLSLAVAYSLVGQAGGSLSVHSEVGQGSAFLLGLPRYTGPELLLRPKEAPSYAARGHECILLVDDEASLLKVTKAVLEGQGYKVLAAASPKEALGLASEHGTDIQLLLTDVVMPQMNGWELAEELQRRLPGLRCAFMSGYTADVISAQGAAKVGVHFIKKPFTIKGLAAQVREALDEHR